MGVHNQGAFDHGHMAIGAHDPKRVCDSWLACATFGRWRVYGADLYSTQHARGAQQETWSLPPTRLNEHLVMEVLIRSERKHLVMDALVRGEHLFGRIQG